MTDQFDDYVGQYSDSVKQFEDEVQELDVKHRQRKLMPLFREDIEKLKNIDWHSAREHGDMLDPIGEVYAIDDQIRLKLVNLGSYLSPDEEQHLLALLGKIRACADQMPEKFKHIKAGYGVPN